MNSLNIANNQELTPNIMTADELFQNVVSEFPMMKWERKTLIRDYIVATYRNRKYEFSLGNFATSVHGGCQFIGVDLSTSNSGTSAPCIGWTEAKNFMRSLIQRYDPDLLVEQQLTLF